MRNIAVLMVVLVVAACSSGTGPPAATSTASEGAGVAPTTAGEPGRSDPPSGPDVSGVDWATVDLTTIDWANIDFRQVDWQLAEDNPTAQNLDEATAALIGSRLDRGSATLTIGDQVWEFDNFLCAFGHEATESEIFSFSTLGTGSFDGLNLRLQADIEDRSGGGLYEGSNVVHRVSLDGQVDSGVRWSARGVDVIQVDGYSVTAAGGFIDHTKNDQLEVPGTLAASCGDQSRRST